MTKTVTDGAYAGSRTFVDGDGSWLMNESIGTIFLGLLAVLLCVALLRSHGHNRALAAQLLRQARNVSGNDGG